MSEKRLLQKVAANDMPSAAHMAGTGESRGYNKKPNRSPASGFDSGRSCDRMSEKRLLQKVAANDMPSAAHMAGTGEKAPAAATKTESKPGKRVRFGEELRQNE